MKLMFQVRKLRRATLSFPRRRCGYCSYSHSLFSSSTTFSRVARNYFGLRKSANHARPLALKRVGLARILHASAGYYYDYAATQEVPLKSSVKLGWFYKNLMLLEGRKADRMSKLCRFSSVSGWFVRCFDCCAATGNPSVSRK